MAWQEQTLRLKAEVNESEAEARRYRQRVVHLDGDLQGKRQWLMHWERQLAMRADCQSSSSLDLCMGPSGLSWSTWKTFVDRGIVESQKTQRLLSRNVNMEWHRATRDELEEEALAAAETVEEAERQLQEEEAENARLAATIRRHDGSARDRARKRSTMDMLNIELAARKSERSRVESEAEDHRWEGEELEASLAEECRKLQELPSQQLLRKVQRASLREGEMRAQCLASAAEAEQRERAAVESASEELQQLNRTLLAMERQRSAEESEARALHLTLEAAEAAIATEKEKDELARCHAREQMRMALQDAAASRAS